MASAGRASTTPSPSIVEMVAKVGTMSPSALQSVFSRPSRYEHSGSRTNLATAGAPAAPRRRQVRIFAGVKLGQKYLGCKRGPLRAPTACRPQAVHRAAVPVFDRQL